MLFSPTHAVVGARDLTATVAFFAAFDFAETARSTLGEDAAAALYGVEGPAECVELRAAGAERGAVRLVQTHLPAPPDEPFASGPYAIDLYTSDIGRSTELARATGATVSVISPLEIGGTPARRARVDGPDGVPVVLIQSDRRRPSLLDNAPERLHSEVHSVVWSVRRIDLASPFWKDQGLSVRSDAPVTATHLGAILGLPKDDVTVRVAMLSDGAMDPLRVELLQFVDETGPRRALVPLRPGLHAVAFAVTDVGKTMSLMRGADFGAVADVDGRAAVRGSAPEGLVFELWEDRPRLPEHVLNSEPAQPEPPTE